MTVIDPIPYVHFHLSMTENMSAAAPFAIENASKYGVAWPTFIAPIRTEKKTLE